MRTLTFNDLSRFYAALGADETRTLAESAPVLSAIAAVAPHHADNVIRIRGELIPTDRARPIIEDAINNRFSAAALMSARFALFAGRAPAHVWEAIELVNVKE